MNLPAGYDTHVRSFSKCTHRILSKGSWQLGTWLGPSCGILSPTMANPLGATISPKPDRDHSLFPYLYIVRFIFLPYLWLFRGLFVVVCIFFPLLQLYFNLPLLQLFTDLNSIFNKYPFKTPRRFSIILSGWDPSSMGQTKHAVLRLPHSTSYNCCKGGSKSPLKKRFSGADVLALHPSLLCLDKTKWKIGSHVNAGWVGRIPIFWADKAPQEGSLAQTSGNLCWWLTGAGGGGGGGESACPFRENTRLTSEGRGCILLTIHL